MSPSGETKRFIFEGVPSLKPLNAHRIESILVLKGDHLGDLICAAPAVHSLRKTFPDARLTLASHPDGIALYRALRLIDDSMDFTSPIRAKQKLRDTIRAVRAARKGRFDLVINLRHDVRDILCGSLMKGRFYCTYDHKGAAFWATHKAGAPDESRYEADNHLRMIQTIGVKPVPWRPPIDPDAAAQIERMAPGGPMIGIHPFARTSARQWPLERFVALARHLTARGYPVVWLGGKEDRGEGERLAVESGSVSLAGLVTFEQLLALLHRICFFIGVDSFIMHAARLVNTPGLALFSGTNLAARWAPPGFAVVKHPVVCEPCRLEVCNVPGHPCMEGIFVEQVIQALHSNLQKGDPK